VRILWVKANKLLPVHSGGDLRSYHLARQLASAHELTFLSYYDGSPDPSYERDLAEHFPGAVCICTGKSESGLARLVEYICHVGKAAPFAVSRFHNHEVQRQIDACFSSGRFDVAICDFLDAAINFPSELRIPSVLFQHNIESEIWRRHASAESNPVKRMLYSLEFRKMLGYERSIVQRFQHVIAVSDHDRDLMSAWTEPSRVSVVPTGVDLKQYTPQKSDDQSSLVVFVGAMDWVPNIDAMEYFCSEIWPKVLAEMPGARFRVVGRNPDARVHKLASSSVEITGRVPSVLDHLREAAVVVVPLRIGGGTRLKIYEAMAAGKAVVSTSVGAEGLDVHNGRDITLVDDPGRFAESVVKLLLDTQRRHQYEVAAAELAAQYDWPTVGQRFAQVLSKVMASPAPSSEECVAATGS